jgi:hypothetical protein
MMERKMVFENKGNGTNRSTGMAVIKCDSYKGIVIDELEISNILSIRRNAFSNSSVKKLVIRNVNSIEAYTFSNCCQLEEVYIDNVDFIDARSFYGCSRIKRIVIKNSPNVTLDKLLFSSGSSDISHLEVSLKSMGNLNTFKIIDMLENVDNETKLLLKKYLKNEKTKKEKDYQQEYYEDKYYHSINDYNMSRIMDAINEYSSYMNDEF